MFKFKNVHHFPPHGCAAPTPRRVKFVWECNQFNCAKCGGCSVGCTGVETIDFNLLPETVRIWSNCEATWTSLVQVVSD